MSAAATIRDRIIEAVGNGSRTITAIYEASGLTKKQVGDNIIHLKAEKIIVTTSDGLALGVGNKMPVKVTRPKPGDDDGCPLSPSERALMPKANGSDARKAADKNGASHPAMIERLAEEHANPEFSGSYGKTMPQLSDPPAAIAPPQAAETPAGLPAHQPEPLRAAGVESSPAAEHPNVHPALLGLLATLPPAGCMVPDSRRAAICVALAAVIDYVYGDA